MVSLIVAGIRDLASILRGNVGIMALSWFLFGLSGALVFPFFTLYAKALRADDFSIAFIRSIGMYLLAFFTIIGGFLTDYFGRVRVIIFGTSLITIIQYLYAFVRDWTQLAILWIIDEVAHFYQPALTAIIMDSLPRDKTLRGFLVLQVFPSIPWLFMPIVGGILWDKLGITGIRIGFIVAGTISAIVVFLRIKGLRETLIRTSTPRVYEFLKDIAKYRKHLVKALYVYLFTGFLVPLVNSVSQIYGPIYVVEVLGGTRTDWGLLTSIGTAFGMATGIALAVRRNINELSVLLLGVLSLSFSQIVFAVPGYLGMYDPIVVGIAVCIGGISTSLIWPATSALLTYILPLEIRGRATGFQRMIENIGLATTSIIAGLLYTRLGPANSLLVSGLIGISLIIYIYHMYMITHHYKSNSSQ
ncbi:MAG: MFS transporter [Thermoprotei archaeon]